MRFDVFGKLISVERNGFSWDIFYLGDDGKKRSADFIIPGSVGEDALLEYLEDMFHEYASPGRKVLKID